MCVRQGLVRVVVEVTGLVFDIGDNFEPYTGSLAVYDLTTQQKITEAFDFDIPNARQQQQQAAAAAGDGDAATEQPTADTQQREQSPWDTRRCTFLIPVALMSHELCVFVYVNRIYQGDPEQAWEIYTTKVRHRSFVLLLVIWSPYAISKFCCYLFLSHALRDTENERDGAAASVGRGRTTV